MTYNERELAALRAIAEMCVGKHAIRVVDALTGTTGHVHTDTCPTLNGHYEFTPAHCPGWLDADVQDALDSIGPYAG
jgi:hypothetical protein